MLPTTNYIKFDKIISEKVEQHSYRVIILFNVLLFESNIICVHTELITKYQLAKTQFVNDTFH